MNAIAWYMVAQWWRLLVPAGQPQCTACGQPGHVAASCTHKLWKPGGGHA